MSGQDEPKKFNINQSTTVSIALVLSMCTGAFWTGSQLTRLTVQTEQLKATQKELRETQESLKDVSKDLTLIAKQNKIRLDYLEDRNK
jgi:uncharacterized membrane protein (DUF106 family)